MKKPDAPRGDSLPPPTPSTYSIHDGLVDFPNQRWTTPTVRMVPKASPEHLARIRAGIDAWRPLVSRVFPDLDRTVPTTGLLIAVRSALVSQHGLTPNEAEASPLLPALELLRPSEGGKPPRTGARARVILKILSADSGKTVKDVLDVMRIPYTTRKHDSFRTTLNRMRRKGTARSAEMDGETLWFKA